MQKTWPRVYLNIPDITKYSNKIIYGVPGGQYKNKLKWLTFFKKGTLHDLYSIENCMLVSKSVNNHLPSIFISWFIFSPAVQNYNTSCSVNGLLKFLPPKTIVKIILVNNCLNFIIQTSIN